MKKRMMLCFIVLSGIFLLSTETYGNPGKPKIVLLANSIDFELAQDLFGFLGNKGMEVVHVDASEFEQYKLEKFIVILGGPDAYDGVGDIVKEILTQQEQNGIRQEGNRWMFTKPKAFGVKGQVVRVIAGSDRNQTKQAHKENRDKLAEKIKAESKEESAQVSDVEIRGFTFRPNTITVPVGTTVRWFNQDMAAHTVTSEDGAFDSGSLGKDDSFSYTFDSAGEFNYTCTFHPSMHGKIVVE